MPKRPSANGLAAAEWYHTDIPRKQMKELMQRSDGPAIRDTMIWLGLLVGLRRRRRLVLGHVVGVPFFLAYGVLYGSSTDSRWHECGHGTAFKTRWMNDAVYQIACFMIMRNPVDLALEPYAPPHRHGHRRPRPRDRRDAAAGPAARRAEFLRHPRCLARDVDMVRNALGNISAAEKTFIPETERPKAIRVARIWVAIYAATIALAIAMGSILPLMLVGLPRLYGAWHHVMTGLLQHGGLADNVIDHRLNCAPSDEPDQPLHLLEHELPCRTPHVPDGALPRAAEAA